LAWHFDKPLVVIEHGKMPLPVASDPMAKQWEAVFHVFKKIWPADRNMDSCERQRRAAITFSVINQSLLSKRSEMSLEREQRLIPQNSSAGKSHLASGRQTFP
jgi:hypothetical protein